MLAQVALYALVISGIYMLITVGLNMIFGVMKALNVAHGELMMLGAYTIFWLFALYGIDPIIGMIIAFPLFFIMGFFLQRLLVAPLIKAKREIVSSSLLVFFGLSIMLQNIAFLLWSADFRSIPYLEFRIEILGISASAIRILAALIALGVTAALHVFLTKTYPGLGIQAITQNLDSAKLMGINIHRLSALTFGIGSATAAVASLVVCTVYIVFPAIGMDYTIKALAILVLGGAGSMKGSVVGSLILGFAESFGTLVIPTGYVTAIGYILLVAILIIKPSGLFGRARE